MGLIRWAFKTRLGEKVILSVLSRLPLDIVFEVILKDRFVFKHKEEIWRTLNDDGRFYFIKDIIKLLPPIEIPDKLYTEEANYLRRFKEIYIARTLDSKRKIERYNKDLLCAQGEEYEDWSLDISGFLSVVERGFNTLILISEADNYYRDRVAEAIVLQNRIHEALIKAKGVNYLSDFLDRKKELNTKIAKNRIKSLDLDPDLLKTSSEGMRYDGKKD